MKYLLLLAIVASAVALSPHDPHLRAKREHRHNRTLAHTVHRGDGGAGLRTLVEASLAAGAGSPWSQLLGLLNQIQKRYRCEDEALKSNDAFSETACDASVSELKAAASSAANALESMKAKCAAAKAAVAAKQAQIETAKAARDAAQGAATAHQKKLTDGESVNSAAVTDFAKLKAETQVAINLVAKMTTDAADLNFAEIDSLSAHVAGMQDQQAKDLSSLALLTVKVGMDGVDTDALKALLGTLRTELDAYLKSLVDNENARVVAWGQSKAQFEKDVKDAQDAATVQQGLVNTYGGELSGLVSAASECDTGLATAQTAADDTSADVSLAEAECVRKSAEAGKMAVERASQLATVASLLQQLATADDLPQHIKNRVMDIQGEEIAGDSCGCAEGCAYCTESECTHGKSGYFLNGGKPQTCTASLPNCAELTVCGDVTDAKCAAAVEGHFADANGDAKPCGTGCKKCDRYSCDAPSPNYFVSGGDAKPLTVCSSSQYQTRAPDANNDRQCATLTVCGNGQVQATAPTATSDRTCKSATGVAGACRNGNGSYSDQGFASGLTLAGCMQLCASKPSCGAVSWNRPFGQTAGTAQCFMTSENVQETSEWNWQCQTVR